MPIVDVAAVLVERLELELDEHSPTLAPIRTDRLRQTVVVMRRRGGEIDLAAELLLLGRGIKRNAAFFRRVEVNRIRLKRHRLKDKRGRVHRRRIKQDGFYFHPDRLAVSSNAVARPVADIGDVEAETHQPL